MTELFCYRVNLPTTNWMHNTAEVNGRYLDVEHGDLYMLASSAEAVGKEFPGALSIIRIGVGYERIKP